MRSRRRGGGGHRAAIPLGSESAAAAARPGRRVDAARPSGHHSRWSRRCHIRQEDAHADAAKISRNGLRVAEAGRVGRDEDRFGESTRRWHGIVSKAVAKSEDRRASMAFAPRGRRSRRAAGTTRRSRSGRGKRATACSTTIRSRETRTSKRPGRARRSEARSTSTRATGRAGDRTWRVAFKVRSLRRLAGAVRAPWSVRAPQHPVEISAPFRAPAAGRRGGAAFLYRRGWDRGRVVAAPPRLPRGYSAEARQRGRPAKRAPGFDGSAEFSASRPAAAPRIRRRHIRAGEPAPRIRRRHVRAGEPAPRIRRR